MLNNIAILTFFVFRFVNLSPPRSGVGSEAAVAERVALAIVLIHIHVNAIQERHLTGRERSITIEKRYALAKRKVDSQFDECSSYRYTERQLLLTTIAKNQ